MDRKEVAGLLVDQITKEKLLHKLIRRIQNGQKTFLTTVYSEFLYNALRDKDTLQLLNSADIAVADGIGILWADYFLSRPFSIKSFYGRIIQSWCQVIYTGAAILIRPQLLYKTFPEKIVGADLIWDIARLAAEQQLTIFLLGGYGDTPRIVKEKLVAHNPLLKVVGISNGQPEDPQVLDQIKQTHPDILFVAYGPLRQERWIAAHLPYLPVQVAMGLGGTFDYIAGVKSVPPKLSRASGLEWSYRLITQPHRIKRIYKAVWGLILSLVRYKVLMSLDYRRNGVAIVKKSDNTILLCRRKPGSVLHDIDRGDTAYWQFPQGGLEEHEAVAAGTMRELFEETGIKSVKVIAESKYVHRYEWNNAMRPLHNVGYRFKGQQQHTVLFEFIGTDDEIVLDDNELVEYRWLKPAEIVQTIAPERIPHAQAVFSEFNVL